MAVGLAAAVAIEGLTKAGAALGTTIKGAAEKLANVYRESIEYADKAQKASLALGKSYETMSGELAGSMNGLRGSIQDRLSSAMEGVRAGLQGNTEGVSLLVNQQKLTGTAFAATAKSMASLQSKLDLSNDQLSSFATNITDVGNKYSISTDKLVASIDSLSESLPFQKLSGWGDKVVLAVTQLQGMFGPQRTSELNFFIKMVMDTSLEGMRKLSALGIGDIRERLSLAKSSNESASLFYEGIKTASENIKIMAGPEGFRGGFAAVESAFGKGAAAITTLADAPTRAVNKIKVEFADSIQTLKSEVWVPLQELFMNKVYPELLTFTKYITKVGKTLTEMLSEELEDRIGKIGPILKDVTTSFVNIMIELVPVIDKLPTMFENLLNSIQLIVSEALYVFSNIKVASVAFRSSFPSFLGGYDSPMELQQALFQAIRLQEQARSGFTPPDLSEASKKTIKVLSAMRDALEKEDVPKLLNEVVDNTGKIVENTDKETIPSYLKESTDILENAVRGILGVGGVNYLEEISDLTKQLIGATEEQTTTIEEGAISNNLAAAVSRA
jgi:hypothetical protein